MMGLVLLVLAAGPATAQTTQQSETSIFYLKQRACAQETAGVWNYAPDPANPQGCLADADCSGAQVECRHRSVVEAAATFYPPLAFPDAPRRSGQGAGVLRYVPLCEDGSGDHEWAVSDGALGTAPTCTDAEYIRCANGVRPFYRANAGTTNDWLIHAGGGGHASAPNVDRDAIWTLAHTQDAGAYSVSTNPFLRDGLGGIFNEIAANPFSDYNRVRIEKCTPDRWLGNKAHHNLQDFTTTLTLETVTGACFDADGNGTANCADNDTTPGACQCNTKDLDPPDSPNNEYSVYYHGKRIVRAVLSDIFGGIAAYTAYPLVDSNQDGQPEPGPNDEAFSTPDANSKIAFHCHSNGCNGLQGGHIDDLHAWIDAELGADVDVRALFSSFLDGSIEAEISVSHYDGVDVNPPLGVPDNEGTIDDSRSLYEHVIDTISVTRQPMSYVGYEPGGRRLGVLFDWWDASDPGYAPPVDASCLAHHCPGSALGWENDPACAPCNESMHVLLNHLDTPFLYNQAQYDRVIRKSLNHCETTTVPPEWQRCDVQGEFLGVDLGETHWRKLVRKMLADLYRLAELDREEGGAGNEWPYNHILLLAPDWADHGSLGDVVVAATRLTLPGASGPEPIATLAHGFIQQTSPASPSKGICLVERTPGENAFDFDDAQKGSVPVCTAGSVGTATAPDAAIPTGYALYPNYPNPFNPSTAIRFDLPQAAHVRLVVYDVTGRQVARLVDAPMAAGTHRAVFDASGLPSGVYLYRLQAGPVVQTQAMVLLK